MKDLLSNLERYNIQIERVRDFPRNHFDLKNLNVSDKDKFLIDLDLILPRAYSLNFLEGKKLLIVGENGFGDCIWFYRYVMKLSKLCDVYFFINEKVKGLFSKVRTITELPKDLKFFDCYIWSFDLLYLFKGDVGDKGPYLEAEPLLEEKDVLRIGFSLGNSDSNGDMLYRNIDSSLISYFKGMGELYNFSNIPNDTCINLLPLKDFCETAGYVQSMDYIVSSDNVMIHLAGALGKRTYAIFTPEQEFIWCGLPDDIFWYDSVVPIVMEEGESIESVFNRLPVLK